MIALLLLACCIDSPEWKNPRIQPAVYLESEAPRVYEEMSQPTQDTSTAASFDMDPEVFKETQRYLSEGGPDATLVDANSNVWSRSKSGHTICEAFPDGASHCVTD